jgi:nitrite reductase/ring-hydroxylating ferredoxin subunit
MKAICKTSDVLPGSGRLVEIEGKAVALFNVDGNFFATEEMCPHRAGPLAEGKLNKNIVECPWHGARFDVTSGKKINGPAVRDLKIYPVRVINEEIFIDSA